MVEMESSAMFNVARFRRIAVANLFVVGDSISDGTWKHKFKSNDIKEKSRSVAKEIIHFLSENRS